MPGSTYNYACGGHERDAAQCDSVHRSAELRASDEHDAVAALNLSDKDPNVNADIETHQPTSDSTSSEHGHQLLADITGYLY